VLSVVGQWEDRARVEGPSAGEKWGFEAFVRAQCGRLIQSLSLVALDRESAADAAQEAFLQLYLHFDEVRDPVPWVYRVAFNRCLDHRRRLARRLRVWERLVEASPAEDWIAPAMAASDFRQLLAELPLKQRTAATLYYLADLSVNDSAMIMNVTEGSVNRHLFRAREALRETLQGWRHSDG
jgi:RNA polymerase sigma factor (sigma-70 family)